MEVQALPARWTPNGGGNRHHVRTRPTLGDTPISDCVNRMMNYRLQAKGRCMWGLFATLALTACLSSAAQGVNEITGSVRNQSRDEPAVGDEVILLRLDRGMEEEARTNTDALGTFTLNAQYSGRPYLVRVVHSSVNYDQFAAAGAALSIQVFDAAAQVRGLTGSIEILRAGTKRGVLHVSDMYEIRNESSPPLTQAGERTFEVYLPANAKIDSVLAAGPEKISAIISARPVRGEPGHYTVNFPLRPGVTKFAFNYDLPYRGRAAFQTRHAYSLQQVAVMIPLTMKFSSRSPAFELLATGSRDYQVQAATQVKAGEGPGFEVSGTGALPPLRDQAESQARPHSPAPTNPTPPAPSRAALVSLASIDSRPKQTQPLSQSLVLNGVTSVLLTACALLVWRTRKARYSSSSAQVVAPRAREGNRST
jgi:hypothetical protein